MNTPYSKNFLFSSFWTHQAKHSLREQRDDVQSSQQFPLVRRPGVSPENYGSFETSMVCLLGCFRSFGRTFCHHRHRRRCCNRHDDRLVRLGSLLEGLRARESGTPEVLCHPLDSPLLLELPCRHQPSFHALWCTLQEQCATRFVNQSRMRVAILVEQPLGAYASSLLTAFTDMQLGSGLGRCSWFHSISFVGVDRRWFAIVDTR